MNLTLRMPMKGWIGPLDEAPDPVFSGRMLGDGVALDPTGSTLYAPCDSEVIALARTRHSVTLRADNGAEILIHIGLDTVALHGHGFTAHVEAGRHVKAGDPLIGFDIDLLAQRAKSLLTPMVITNPEAFEILWREQDREADVGEPLMVLRAFGAASSMTPSKDDEHQRRVCIGLPHGLHARPAGKAAAMIKPFSVEISVGLGAHHANARSPVALMTLGVTHGEDVVLTATGVDAEAALAVLGDFLAGDGGEVVQTPLRAEPAPPIVNAVAGVLKGVSAAPGQAIGRAFQFHRGEIRIREAGTVDVERAALSRAIASVGTKISQSDRGASHGIMAAHLALLEDPELHAATDAMIAAGKSAGFAWSEVLDAQAAALDRLDDVRLKARATDLIDLKRQVLIALGGAADVGSDTIPSDAILLADDILPSELMAMDGRILGLCTAAGGPTSHVAIIAAGLNLPAVAAVGPGVLAVHNGAPLILDADAATLHIDPDAEALAAAQARSSRRTRARDAAILGASVLCRMADETRIEVFANLAGVSEAGPAIAAGAEGCGLLRSEFLFMDRAAPPDEAEQLEAYQAIADALDGRPLIIRTLDIGGDKPVAYLSMPKEENPALGLRGIRTSLWRPQLLRTQLRAVLRVTPGVCKIMAPMVASVEELIAVRTVLDEERRALGLSASIPIGVMIETPAAAVTAAAIAAEADFLSIGTNDLTQYALAMDRTNAAMAKHVDALHPAVLRLIALTCEGAAVHGRPVGVCGRLASEPSAAALLIGLGVTELSATPSAIAELKATIRPLHMPTCRALAAEALAQTSAGAVRALLAEAQTDALDWAR